MIRALVLNPITERREIVHSNEPNVIESWRSISRFSSRKRTRPCDIWRSIRQYSACEKLSISGGELRVIFGHFIRNENQYQDCREKGSFMKANEIVLGNIEIFE